MINLKLNLNEALHLLICLDRAHLAHDDLAEITYSLKERLIQTISHDELIDQFNSWEKIIKKRIRESSLQPAAEENHEFEDEELPMNND